MDSVAKYQGQLLEQAQFMNYEAPISEAVGQAFMALPRHLFVNRYRMFGTKEWQDVTAQNIQEHLGRLYADEPVCLLGDDDNDVISTISQPSFVLRSLDMLQLRAGQRVFELGTASGWNAALMAHLVQPGGHVYSIEIMPQLAGEAAERLDQLGIPNVTVVEADGGDGYAPGAPYDRATFTAGTYDLPRHFYKQMKEGGLLLVGIKNEGGGDNLFLLRKTADHFESVESMPCGWVQMRGKYHIDKANPEPIEALDAWNELQTQEISKTPFWWSVKGREPFVWVTAGVRSFLGITEPCFRTFKVEKTPKQPREERYFGLWDEEHRSLVLAKHDCLIAYGNAMAKERLMERLQQWVNLGMPTGSSFELQVYPAAISLTPGQNQWITKREESQFLWSLGTTQ